MEMEILLSIVGVVLSIFALCVYIMVCYKLAKTAEEKGNIAEGLGVGCFFFGIPFMIWVASLPDLKARKTTEFMK